MGVSLDTRRHANQQALAATRRAGCHARSAEGAKPDDLVERVDNDPADAGTQRGCELLGGLVVAVAHKLLTARSSRERDGHLPAGRDVERHLLLEGQRSHRLAQEGLGCVGDAGPETGNSLAAPIAHVVFVVDEHRRPDLLRQLQEVDPADTQVTVAGDRGRVGKQVPKDRAVGWRRWRGRLGRGRPGGRSGAGHIASGARTPRRSSAIARPIWTPSTSHKRACVSSGGTSSERIRQSW